MRNKMNKIALAWMLVACMVAPLFSSAMAADASDSSNSGLMDYDSMTMEELFNSEEDLTWVFAGDSITHNTSYTQGANGYPEWFEQYLVENGREEDAVVIPAWGGADIYDFQTTATENNEDWVSGNPKFPTKDGAKSDPGLGIYNMVTKYNPDVIFIKEGMNDRGKTTEVYDYFYRKMLDNIYEICETEYNKIPKIIIITPTPVASENYYDDLKAESSVEAHQDNTRRHRNALQQIAEDYGLEFVDFRTAFINEGLKLGDDYKATFYNNGSDNGLHPNAAGQYFMFKTLCESLELDTTLPMFDYTYDDFQKAELYVDGTDGVNYANDYVSGNWDAVLAVNSVWAVAGAEQMSGYEGNPVNRSMFRFLDNVMRVNTYRDIRMVNASADGYTVASILNDYNSVIGKHAPNVVLVLPEVSAAYSEGYEHSDELVADYKAAVQALIAENTKQGAITVLWTPLASGDAQVNEYMNDYADAVREVVAANSDIMFYDANKFMNDNMSTNEVLKRNWFEDEMNITPLCANDVVRAFYTAANKSGLGLGELSTHNLRYTSDERVVKGTSIRDNIASEVTVDGTTVTIDISAIKAAYPGLTNVRLAVMPAEATGNYNENIINLADVAEVAVSGNKYTFEAPCSDPLIAVYGKLNGYTYRFKDMKVAVETDATIELAAPNPDGAYLNSLEVVGAPALTFGKDTTGYDVTLYQYQRFVQILATAQDGLTITVDGEAVESGEYSQVITVEDEAVVTVKVSGTVNGAAAEKIYTLNLTRPEYPDIIITEVMQDGYANYEASGGDNYELIEIYNASGRDLNLKDYAIGYKKDYRYTSTSAVAEYPNYYFTGDDNAFAAKNGSSQTYTGINPITKYSSYWSDNTVTEPDVINFPADSTMVIWVKFAASSDPEAYSKKLTYDTLIQALGENKDRYTLSVDGTAVVPVKDQLVLAEIPKGEPVGGLNGMAYYTAEQTNDYFYMDAHGGENTVGANHSRNWLFVLEKDAVQAENGSVTEAGNDIISALKQIRLQTTNKLSSVFSYNTDRGMSIVKNEGYWNEDTVGLGHTSDQQGYSNLTSFGAIEYWQKPVDSADTTAPTVENASPENVAEGESANISLTLKDDTDVRYVELYVMKDGETEWTKATKDFVLQAGVDNAGVSKDITNTSFVYELGQITGTTKYYGFVLDGNNNKTTFGTEEEPLTMEGPSAGSSVTGEIGTEKVVEVEGEEVKVVIGDVTGDGNVNIIDFTKLRAYLIGKITLEEKYLLASDVNGDGRTSIADYMRIRAYLIK